MNTSFITALQNHTLSAHVDDCDHYRIHGGLAVETDYIILVQPTTTTSSSSTSTTTSTTTTNNDTSFESFRISKTYSAFRLLVQQLKFICDQYNNQNTNMNKNKTSNNTSTSTSTSTHNDTSTNITNIINIIQYCTMIYHMIDMQRTTYLGKVNYIYVKEVLTKQRIQIINSVLQLLIYNCYPSINISTIKTTNNDTIPIVSATSVPSSSTASVTFITDITNVIHTFFLTDYLVNNNNNDPKSTTTATKSTGTTNVDDNVNSKTNTLLVQQQQQSNPFLWIGDTVKNVASTVVTNTTSTLSNLNIGGNVSNNNNNNNNNTNTTENLTVDIVSSSTNNDNSNNNNTETETSATTIVIPMSQRSRRSTMERTIEDDTLQQVAGQDAKLLVTDDQLPTNTNITNMINTYNNNQKVLVPNYSQPTRPIQMLTSVSSSFFNKWIDHNPISFIILCILIIIVLQFISHIQINIDCDLFLLCIFGTFCIGLHTPRPMILGYDYNNNNINNNPQQTNTMIVQIPKKYDRSGRRLLRQSMLHHRTSIVPTTTPGTTTMNPSSNNDTTLPVIITTDTPITGAPPVGLHSGHDDYEDDCMDGTNIENNTTPMGNSPMAMFPDGAELGTHLNCWSRPDPSTFHVRGPNYLIDKKKIPSASEYIFPCRGIDLFLTDTCPQNVGKALSYYSLGGTLRHIPTFIINFRLPWGILLFYCEIPTKFIPFIEVSALFGTPQYDQVIQSKNLLSILKDMTPADRTVARWCMNDAIYKNKTLKIVPVVVDGPWVVKSVVGGKPAIIGAKLPINYIYEPGDGPKQQLYLEADLDIAASSAARGILSVTRSYTQILTMNLGFVIQANEADELPEQMLTGARLHGIDPITAPSLPPIIQEEDIIQGPIMTDEESE